MGKISLSHSIIDKNIYKIQFTSVFGDRRVKKVKNINETVEEKNISERDEFGEDTAVCNKYHGEEWGLVLGAREHKQEGKGGIRSESAVGETSR